MRLLQASDAEEVRSEAERILSDPKYQVDEPGLVDRALRFLGELIDRTLGRYLSSGMPGSNLVGYVVLAVLAVVIGYLLWKNWPSHVLRRRSKAAVTDIEVRERTSRDAWLAEAERAAAEGRWADAVHARYRATIAGLVDRGEVPETKGLTALESLAVFDAEIDRRDALGSEVMRFRDVRYGGVVAGADDDGELRRLDERVLTVGRGAGRRPVSEPSEGEGA